MCLEFGKVWKESPGPLRQKQPYYIRWSIMNWKSFKRWRNDSCLKMPKIICYDHDDSKLRLLQTPPWPPCDIGSQSNFKLSNAYHDVPLLVCLLSSFWCPPHTPPSHTDTVSIYKQHHISIKYLLIDFVSAAVVAAHLGEFGLVTRCLILHYTD